jgi:hypothetical protein
MKITIGGSMGFKKTGKPYENIDSMTYFSIEKDVPEEMVEQTTKELNEKVNKILAEEATKKMIMAYKTYRDKIVKLEALLDSGE